MRLLWLTAVVAVAVAIPADDGGMSVGDAEVEEYANLMMARSQKMEEGTQPLDLDESIKRKRASGGFKRGGPEITPLEAFSVKECCDKEVKLDASYILPLHSCAEVRVASFEKVLQTMKSLEKRTGISNTEIVKWLKDNDCRKDTYPTYSPTPKPRGHCHRPPKHCPHVHKHKISQCSKKCGGGKRTFCRREELNKNRNGCENKCGHVESCNNKKCPTRYPTSYPTSYPTVHICDRHSMGEAVTNCAHVSKHGVCYKDSTRGIFFGDYKCGCESGYHCVAGCDKAHVGHKCEKTPVDCQGKWDDWSSCSRACGTEGKWLRVYNVTQDAANGGKACPHYHGEVEEASCNRHTCGCNHVHCLFERKEVYVNAGRLKINPNLPSKRQFAHDMAMSGQFYVHKTIVVRHDARESLQYGMQHKCALANKGLEQQECRCICSNHNREDSDAWEKCKYDNKLFQKDCKRGLDSHWLADQANAYPKGLATATAVNQRKFFHSCNKLTGCDSEERAASKYAPVTDINEKISELQHEEQHLVSDANEEISPCEPGWVLWAITPNKWQCTRRIDTMFHKDIVHKVTYNGKLSEGHSVDPTYKPAKYNSFEINGIKSSDTFTNQATADPAD